MSTKSHILLCAHAPCLTSSLNALPSRTPRTHAHNHTNACVSCTVSTHVRPSAAALGSTRKLPGAAAAAGVSSRSPTRPTPASTRFLDTWREEGEEGEEEGEMGGRSGSREQLNEDEVGDEVEQGAGTTGRRGGVAKGAGMRGQGIRAAQVTAQHTPWLLLNVRVAGASDRSLPVTCPGHPFRDEPTKSGAFYLFRRAVDSPKDLPAPCSLPSGFACPAEAYCPTPVLPRHPNAAPHLRSQAAQTQDQHLGLHQPA